VKSVKAIKEFITGLLRVLFVGSVGFYVWMSILTVFAAAGFIAYSTHLTEGLVVTNMRDQANWGFYIANFAFLVGIAAAAVLLIIPAYFYNFKPIKKIVVYGELLAVAAIMVAGLFITADMGGPERVWHIAPPPMGHINFPSSILAWDMLVLNGYMAVNFLIALYIGYNRYFNREANMKIALPLIILSIPFAIGVNTVTAFVFNGLAARPFWNASILAPRFLASAFCSGPALMIIIFQMLRKYTDFDIEDAAISRLAEIIVYALSINLFLLGAEVFKEYYSATEHLDPMQYLYQGLDGHHALVPWIWTAMLFNVVAFVIFLFPQTRHSMKTLNIGCVLIFFGIWVEKGMGLVFPGFIPDTLGEIYEYMPSMKEIWVTLGFWSFGAMVYIILVRIAVAVDSGRFRLGWMEANRTIQARPDAGGPSPY
jgi:molybdopterin-containing oxidoreductase family membrane subunit